MKLRTFGVWISTAVVVAGVGTATALVVISDFIEEATRSIEISVESVYAAEQLAITLVLHNRDRFLADLTGSAEHRSRAVQHQIDIGRWLERSRALVTSAAEAQKYEAADRAIRFYLAERLRLGKEGLDAVGVYQRASGPLEAAFAAVEAVVDQNRDDALHAATRARRQDETADILGLAAGALLIALAAVVLGVGDRALLRPLRALREAMTRFGDGTFQHRASTMGLTEIREMSRVFNELAEGAARAREGQIRFLASIAHDIRNPLGAIRMSTDMLIEETDPEAVEVRQILEVIGRQARRLDRMVTDLLDMARTEGGHLRLSMAQHDLRELVADAARLYQSVSAAHQVTVDAPSAPVLCSCDGDRVSQVVNNLLSNAIKYSPYGGGVRVSITAAAQEVRIAVSDPGIGIAADEIAHIFEPFRRSPATRDGTPGAGLGLASARKIAELHGGRIEVESSLGHGSVFSLILPCAAAGSPADEPPRVLRRLFWLSHAVPVAA